MSGVIRPAVAAWESRRPVCAVTGCSAVADGRFCTFHAERVAQPIEPSATRAKAAPEPEMIEAEPWFIKAANAWGARVPKGATEGEVVMLRSRQDGRRLWPVVLVGIVASSRPEADLWRVEALP